VATPPNAIVCLQLSKLLSQVFSYGKVTVFDMVTSGGLLNLIGVFVVPVFILICASGFGIEIGSVPEWAETNSTKRLLTL